MSEVTASASDFVFACGRMLRTRHCLNKFTPLHSLRLSPSMSQHLTINPGVINLICDSARIRSTDSVLEIGVGTGNLTEKLLTSGASITGIEIDYDMLSIASSRFRSNDNLNLIHGDAIRFLKNTKQQFDVIVANPPYKLSSELIFSLTLLNFRTCVLVLQKEFADKLLADPGNKGFTRLSLNSSLFLRTESIKSVKSESFYPKSTVESSIVRVTPAYPRPLFEFREWDSFTRICYRDRRRSLRATFSKRSNLAMLENIYKRSCGLKKVAPSRKLFPDLIAEALEEVQIADISGFKLRPKQLEKLLTNFHHKGIYFSNLSSGTIANLDPIKSTGDFIAPNQGVLVF
jgi:18S rRNA (adenine1779-N6/adenine1780-N6)-dimethyltransferase